MNEIYVNSEVTGAGSGLRGVAIYVGAMQAEVEWEDGAVTQELLDDLTPTGGMVAPDEKVSAALDVIIQQVNYMGNGRAVSRAVVDKLRHTHRTLQQSLMRLVVMPILKEQARVHRMGAGWYDLRNEASVHLAAKILPDEVKGADHLPNI